MFNSTRVRTVASVIAMVAMLGACGGGGSSDATPAKAVVNDFSSSYSTGLAKLTSFTGLNNAAFADLFDNAFLEGGVTKADVMDALQSEAQAVAVSPDFPSFARVTLSDVTISNCDATTQVCTLSGTLTNQDVDTTSVPFTTQVKLSDKARLYGDQSTI